MPAGVWRLTDRGIAVVLVLALMIAMAALAVIGLTAWQVTSADYSPAPRRWGLRSARDDHDGAHDLVGERLLLVVPQRPEEADVSHAVEDVDQVAQEGVHRTDRRVGQLADQPDLGHPLAEGLPGAAPDQPAVVDRPAGWRA